jgi:precorrin-2 dehydrogenase/sirohydrochlorin ferrochelatase
MAKYPINLDLTEKRVVVIGAGPVAARKVISLCDAGADILVIAKKIHPEFDQLCKGLPISILKEPYNHDHLENATLTIAATSDNELNKQIYADCKTRNILCNVVDVPPLCDFYVPALINCGALQIAIGTDGKCPAYAAQIRRKLEKLFTEDHADFLDALDTQRKIIVAGAIPPKNRKAALKKLAADESFDLFTKKDPQAWNQYAENTIKEFA